MPRWIVDFIKLSRRRWQQMAGNGRNDDFLAAGKPAAYANYPASNKAPAVCSHGMSNKPISFPPRNNSGSNSVFMRERMIINVANLRYELDLICILTPLPPVRTNQLAVLKPLGATDRSKSSKTRQRGPIT
jgi:hypothetical protein